MTTNRIGARLLLPVALLAMAETSCSPPSGDQQADQPQTAQITPSVPEAADATLAPACSDPDAHDVLRELWIDENGVGQARQVTRISDAVEFRYDPVRDKRYCNVSIFINGYDVSVRQPDGTTAVRRHDENRIGFSITNHPETEEFTVEVAGGWLPYVDESLTPFVGLALAQRPEVCERMFAEFAADPNEAPYLWTLDEPGADCPQ